MSAESYNKEILDDIFRRVIPRDYTSVPKYLWPKWFSELLMLQDVHDIMHIKVSIGTVMISWIMHIMFWFLLAVYLDNINPGKFGSAKAWYYFFKVRSATSLSSIFVNRNCF